MFEIQPSIQQLEADREDVISISSSVNHPHVAVPGKPTQKAEAFVVALRESGLNVVFVCLWLDLDQHQVIYTSEPVTDEELEDLRQEGLGFCESMGFIMEEIPFAQLDVASQEETLSQLPPFSSQRGRLASSMVGAEPELSAVGQSVASPTPSAPIPTPIQPAAEKQVDVLELSRLGKFFAKF